MITLAFIGSSLMVITMPGPDLALITLLVLTRRRLQAERLRSALRDDLDSGFALVMREYQHTVYTTVLRVCGHRTDAEDLTVEVFLRAYRAPRGYTAERIDELHLRPWLATTALNMGRSTARDLSRRPRQIALERFIERPLQGDAFDDIAVRLDYQRVLAEHWCPRRWR